jgi:hypothetical protein
MHIVLVIYHALQNMPAIATKLLFLLYFSQHVSALADHLQVEYNINNPSKVLSILQRIRCAVLSVHAVRTALTLITVL